MHLLVMKLLLERSKPLVLALPGLVPFFQCSCTPSYSLQALDRLARTSGAKTIILNERLSLYSPDDPFQAQEFLALIESQRTEVYALFGVDDESPVIVQLHPNEGLGVDVTIEGNQMRLNRLLTSPDGGILGKAGDHVMIIEVAAPKVLKNQDGSPHVVTLGASMYRSTIRHELTHLATNLLGVRGGDWLREGIAHAVEWIPIEEGRFTLDPAPESLRQSASLPREHRELDRLLAWKQGFPPKEHDPRERMLAHSLVTFLIEREGAPSLREGLLRVADHPPVRIRAAQAAWSAWLDGFASPAP